MVKVLMVNLKVKPEHIETFKAVTMENVLASRQEPGIARFDLLQDEADATRFSLVEVYREKGAHEKHKETAHYLRWKEKAEPLMAEPRTRSVYDLISQA